MNRSVIIGTVAVVVLSAGGVLTAASPAAAEPNGSESAADAGNSTGGDRPAGPRRRGQVDRGDGPAGQPAGGKDDQWPWPCSWPTIVPPVLDPAPTDPGGNGVIPVLPAITQQVVPVAGAAGVAEPQPPALDAAGIEGAAPPTPLPGPPPASPAPAARPPPSTP
ncbi:MAG: hypothetical protein FGM52_09180, partial [Mycobacterium sp.]|nr:hypothetical protein [Mycobacterium sp.]